MIPNIKTIDDMCLQWNIARKQRKTELYNNKGLKGTQGYEEMGCYRCDGYNKMCEAYISKEMLK